MQWLITGCSSGLGLHLARAVLSAGYKCIATSRNPGATPELVAEIENLGGTWVSLDVSDSNLERAVQGITDAYGPVDVLVNNAGFGDGGPLETFSTEAAKSIMDVNFFGPLRLTKVLIPNMRERRQGVIVNVSSAAFWAAHPGTGMYAASKFALEGLSESLSGELAPFGIRVIIAEPGEMRTRFIDEKKVSHIHVPEAYKGTPTEAVLDFIIQRSGKQTIDPERVAKAIVDQVSIPPSSELPLRLPLGSESLDLLTAKAKSLSELASIFTSLARDCDFPENKSSN